MVTTLMSEDAIRAGHLKPQELNREVQPELRQMVFLRDNYTCFKCNTHQDQLCKGLHCHHIEGVRWNPLESADADQCKTVCETCHIEIHKQPDCGYRDMRCDVDQMEMV
jgi:5-methylcytosine-specific restriction endonuclease McrA